MCRSRSVASFSPQQIGTRAVTLTTERNLKRLACQSLSCSRPCDGRCRDGRTGGRELIRSNNNTSQPRRKPTKTQETARNLREQAHHQQQETEEARRGVLACGGVSAILCLGARVALFLWLPGSCADLKSRAPNGCCHHSRQTREGSWDPNNSRVLVFGTETPPYAKQKSHYLNHICRHPHPDP